MTKAWLSDEVLRAQGTRRPSGWRLSLVLATLFTALLPVGPRAVREAAAIVHFTKDANQCEPPHQFYAPSGPSGHQRPCCPLVEGMCPGGSSCNATPGSAGSCSPEGGKISCSGSSPCPGTQTCTSDGRCSGSGTACSSSNPSCPTGEQCDVSTCKSQIACSPSNASRTSIILFIGDDHGECLVGSAGECRSAQLGTPIPAPATPNLDQLAGSGTIFPIAHDSASVCSPSLDSILTGRYQGSFPQPSVGSQFASKMLTIPGALRTLSGLDAVEDPYDKSYVSQNPNVASNPNALAKIGGYCTFKAGKFAASIEDSGFDARGNVGDSKLGRLSCSCGSSDCNSTNPPQCGTGDGIGSAAYGTNDPLKPTGPDAALADLFNFIDSLVYKDPITTQYTIQRFFAWWAPSIPHSPLKPPQPVLDYLFGPGCVAASGLNCAGACSTSTNPASCPIFQLGAYPNNLLGTFVSETNGGGSEIQWYGQVWWLDESIREIRKFLEYEGRPHCLKSDGRSDFTGSNCAIQNVSVVADLRNQTDLRSNTVIIYLSDNGRTLPHAKTYYTENGFRTRLIVYDPLGTTPPTDSWKRPPSCQQGCASGTACSGGYCVKRAQVSPALAHATDLMPTILGYALNTTAGSQGCPSTGRQCSSPPSLRARWPANHA